MLNLTADDVRQWRKELVVLEAEEAEMKARHAAEERAIKERRTKLNKLVAAAAAFLNIDPDEKSELDEEPKEQAAPVSGRKASAAPDYYRHGKGGTWRETVYRIIKESGHSIEYSDLKEAVAQTHLGEILKRTDKSFYGALRRLEKARKIVRHNGKAYLPDAYHQFMEDVRAGRAVDEPAGHGSSKESPNHAAILEYLGKRPSGEKPSKILDDLLSTPPRHLNVSKNRGSLHNAMSRLRERGLIIKRGERYFLREPKIEAPDSDESSASDHNGDGTGNPSSSGNGGSGLSLVALSGANPTHPGE